MKAANENAPIPDGVYRRLPRTTRRRLPRYRAATGDAEASPKERISRALVQHAHERDGEKNLVPLDPRFDWGRVAEIARMPKEIARRLGLAVVREQVKAEPPAEARRERDAQVAAFMVIVEAADAFERDNGRPASSDELAEITGYDPRDTMLALRLRAGEMVTLP